MELFEKLTEESDRAYLAFQQYRDFRPLRSIDKAYRQYRGIVDPKHRANRHWLAWSSKYNWPERAQAYDAHLEGIELEIFEREIVKLAQRRAARALVNQTKLEEFSERLNAVLIRAEACPVTDEVKEGTKETVGKDGEVVKAWVKQKTWGTKLSGYSRLAEVYKDTLRETHLGPQPDKIEAMKTSTTRDLDLSKLSQEELETLHRITSKADPDRVV